MSNSPKVQVSNNYDEFQFLTANREQYRGHIEALKKAFEDIGNLTRVQPILVNENMEIVDGQHRFIACQELGEPIYYTQVSGLRVSDARRINVLHKSWKFDDYAKSYATTDPNYQKYLEVKEDYGFNNSVTLHYILNSHSSDVAKGIFKQFRLGEFVLEDEKGARKRLEILADVGQYVPFVGREAFAGAILRAIAVEGFSVKRFLSKLELNQHLLKEYAGIGDNLRMIEEIYNFKMTESNRLRLY